MIIVLSGLQEMADITSKAAMAPVTPKATSGKHGGNSEASEGTQFSSLGGFRFGSFYKIWLTQLNQIVNPGSSVLAKLSPFKKGLISSLKMTLCEEVIHDWEIFWKFELEVRELAEIVDH